ncbi:oligopeptide/dipeptide ABC transporter, ATP-binding protein domain [Bacillus cereus BAG1X2-3]|jgi:peptide/nickel transport system ATP-binding protein|uniref:ABC transporter ATP-binding protein n=3 Tax=Bacillus cereus group TaxID=86661 RepID=A0A9X7HKR5_BACCE|nr:MULTISPECIES: ABC transporter ATP-binding protein [Bacillus cereus group]EOO23158.1 oligopeptide/dipeptide ABC transporter, ATP-binding protein domain [Bacillus cereus BAG1X1-1]EOO46946.1 oligopeptide/dipeptide ABC transporter, ATP-binding protein domain [Bacillus cereus BAG1X2-2]EOO55064.1 oligopeptide/dipeptide ABC transporter, ATP-binding protein domain [Bacillus cereus BAG1X2-1]EOO63695.1 oligopeptide/dipeptide ABC transporter, ATP-binding protein domain [Bacillus cereus BAG1X2-3]EOP111
MSRAVVELKDLQTHFQTEEGTVKAVNHVSFAVREGETVCVVGESGCGKSVTALSIMGLIAESGSVVGGDILYEGKSLLGMKEKELRSLRGNDIAMIFQEPMTSLNPVFTVGEQIVETLREHELLSKNEAYKKAIELIRKVGIARADEIVHSYPHELSGGMLQRIMIAVALSCNPKLLIADEPTTALDVTIQAQILDLLRQVKEEFKTSILLITHDLGVVAEMADYVVVMYGGKVIEEAPVLEIFQNPKHPYTKGLLKSKPVMGKRIDKLYSIPGQVPNLVGLGEFCYFSGRCEHCMEICEKGAPNLNINDENHKVACWLYEERAEQ